jgi:hypothetical protein
MKTFCLFKNQFIIGKNRGSTFGVNCTFGISFIITNNFRNFSATNGKNKYTWVRYFPENEYYVILPCIDVDISFDEFSPRIDDEFSPCIDADIHIETN